jgi:pimeloyl-ACP methyl ester carboxylesterase
MAIRLFDRIAQEFDWKGPVSTVFESPTPRLLVKALRSPNENSGVLSFHTEGQRPPFFLLHGTSCLPHLTRALGPHHPLYCVVSNWSESFLQDGLTVEEIADLYLTRLKPYLVDGPFYLGGFSLGGMVGIELARKLAALGNPPAVLFLLDPTALGGKKPPPLRLPPLIKHQVATFQHRVKDRLQRQKDPIRMHNTRVYHQAIRRYDGSDYSGETVLWYTSQSTLDSWRPHLKGRLLAQALPATHVGFHQDEEIVRRWTGTLRDVLNGLDPHS